MPCSKRSRENSAHAAKKHLFPMASHLILTLLQLQIGLERAFPSALKKERACAS
jgi:hypothetical protein